MTRIFNIEPRRAAEADATAIGAPGSFRWSLPGLPPTTNQRRIVVACEARQKKYARLPADLAKNAKIMAHGEVRALGRSMRLGAVDYVVVCSKTFQSGFMHPLPKNICPVYVYTRNIGSLPDDIHALLGITAPEVTKTEAPQLTLPEPLAPVETPEVAFASAPPPRAAWKWTPDEEAAVRIAYEKVGPVCEEMYTAFRDILPESQPRTAAGFKNKCKTLYPDVAFYRNRASMTAVLASKQEDAPPPIDQPEEAAEVDPPRRGPGRPPGPAKPTEEPPLAESDRAWLAADEIAAYTGQRSNPEPEAKTDRELVEWQIELLTGLTQLVLEERKERQTLEATVLGIHQILATLVSKLVDKDAN